jgi:hypothetical protein
MEICNINLFTVTKSEAEHLYLESGWKWIVHVTLDDFPYWQQYQPSFDEMWATMRILLDDTLMDEENYEETYGETYEEGYDSY